MSSIRNSRFAHIDWISIGLLLSLMSLGWAMIFTVTYKGEEAVLSSYVFNLKTLPGKQLLFIGLALLVIGVTQFVEEKLWHTMAYVVYGLCMLSLIAVVLIGTEVKGAKSWFMFAGFSLQPSEFAKFGTALAMAAYLSTYSTNLRKPLHQLLAAIIFMVPAGLIMLQPDAGSALVFLSFLLVMYREGMPNIWYIVGFLLVSLLVCSLKFGYEWVMLALLALSIGWLAFDQPGQRTFWRWSFVGVAASSVYLFLNEYMLLTMAVLGGILIAMLLYQFRLNKGRFIRPILALILLGGLYAFSTDFAFEKILKPHQQDRINVWLRPELSDPSGSAYNLEHSKIAIGSGGFLGKGFLNGIMTKGNMVPEQSTDFIFTTIGEEHGFLGSVSMLLLFGALLWRLTILAERQKTDFSRVYIYGVTGILFLHFFINIGMTIGLVPIIGIPLPFISYGGSSLLGFAFMMGVALRMDGERWRR